MEQPASVARVQKAIEAVVEDLQRTHLIPRQKEAFLCCARCCDTASGPQDLQQCVERCSMGSMQQQKAIQNVMQDFQERFQRCALRCQDLARWSPDPLHLYVDFYTPQLRREVTGFNPTPSEEAKGRDKFNSCMDQCGKEFEGKVPRLKQDILDQLKRL